MTSAHEIRVIMRAKELYDDISEYIRDDMIEAAIWARKTLTEHEGSGHHFELSATRDGFLICSFAKPQWSGDHSGSKQEDAATAILMAVCEYMAWEGN